MSSVRIQEGDTERIWATILDSAGAALTGKTDIVISIERNNAGTPEWLDWADSTFKTAGWTTRQLAMTEVSAANSPGRYYADLDTSIIVSAAADDTYLAFITQTPGTDAANVPQTGEIKVGQIYAEIELSRKLLNNRQEVADGGVGSGNLVTYDDDDLTPIATSDLSDVNNDGITNAIGVPARRSRGLP